MNKVLINLSASLTYALVQWLIITIISREMSVSDAGIYAYYLAIFSPLAILCSLGIRNNIATDINKDYLDKEYKSLRNIGLIFYFIVFLILFCFFNKSSFILCSIFLFKLIDLISELTYGSWIRSGKTSLYGISRLLKSAITLIVMTICLISLNYYDQLIYVYFFISLIVIVLFDNRMKILASKENSDLIGKGVQNLFLFSLPLIFSSFIVSLNVGVPRFFLSSISMDAVAIYTMLTYFGSIAIMPLMSAYPVYMSTFSNKSLDRRKLLKKITFLTILYSLGYFIFILIFCPFIMEYIYKITDFTMQEVLLSGIFGSLQILLVWQNFLITCERKFKVLFKNNVLNFFLVLFFCGLLVSKYLLLGGLLSMCLASFVLIILNFKEIQSFKFGKCDI
jgi:O-antigen/teichoic acid export membrane protein